MQSMVVCLLHSKWW